MHRRDVPLCDPALTCMTSFGDIHPHDDSQPTTMMVGAAIGGSTNGHAWVVERFGPLLLAQARYRLRGSLRAICEPEDLVNDVWSICLPRLKSLEPRNGRSTPVLVKFLATTLLNRFNTLIRDHLTGGAVRWAAPLDTADLEELAGDTNGIETKTMRREQVNAMLAALQKLNESEREVVVLRAIEQLPNHVVASELGIPPNTAAVRFKRAVARLGDLIPGSVISELV